jgi:colanic acid biosynthesis glycosyl transferase WcaI
LKILLVVNNFYPEIGSAAQVYSELGKGFVKRGHEVHVITMYPRKFYLSEANRDKDFPMDENFEGLLIHRCRIKFANRDNVILRGLEHFLVPSLYFSRYKKLQIKFDGIVFYIPPLPLYRMANMIRKYDGTRSVLNFQDIHPQELIDVGLVKNPLIIKYLEKLEKHAYKDADYITVLSFSGMNLIKERGGNPNNIQHIFNGINPDEIDKYLKRKDYKEIEGIKNKFLISYAGMINSFQGIDDILDVAKRFVKDDSIVFYIVGDGMEKKRLRQRLESEKITNVVMKPLQPKEEYYNIINSSDLSIVSLDRRMTAPCCIPGKFTNLAGASQCILASVPSANDLSRIVTEYNCGLSINPGDILNFENAIRSIKDDKRRIKEIGNNSRRFFEQNLNVESCVIKYEDIFAKLKTS